MIFDAITNEGMMGDDASLPLPPPSPKAEGF